MTYPIGATVTLPVTVFAADGVTLTDPASISLVVTKPDLTTQTFAIGGLTHDSTGKYHASYIVAAKGLHGWTWVANTPFNSYGPDSFYGADPALTPVVSLADVRQQLRSYTTAADSQLLAWAIAATVLAEQYTHRAWSTRTFTHKADGGQPTILLPHTGVQSITSVVEDGTSLTAADYSLDTHGVLWRGPIQGYNSLYWLSDMGPVVITYVAGPTNGVVPDNVRLGCLEMVQHLAVPTRGGSGRPAQSTTDTVWAPGMTFPIPRRVAGFWDGSKGSGL